jgi:uncharacterized phage infection (PIP) family protein YhgE
VNRSFAQTAPLSVSIPAPASQPSTSSVQTLLDARQYQAAARQASKLLFLKGSAATDLDRFQLVMLKGYAQAGMHSNSTAIMTFRSAQKETKDPNQIALAKWTAELFHTAGSTTYSPKTGPVGAPKPGPFDLLDTDQREAAFGALLDDNLTLMDPKLKQATISQSLNEIWPVLQKVLDLDNLDVIANRSDDKTLALASSLLDHSRNLLSNALKQDWARVSDIDSHANITTIVPTQIYVNNTLVSQTVTKKNGLSDSNKSELSNIIQVCQKIHDAANSFMSLAKSDKDWTTVLSDSDRVAARASDVLNADYGQAVSTGSTDTTTIGGYPQTGIINQFPGGSSNVPIVPRRPVQPPTKTKTGSGS